MIMTAQPETLFEPLLCDTKRLEENRSKQTAILEGSCKVAVELHGYSDPGTPSPDWNQPMAVASETHEFNFNCATYNASVRALEAGFDNIPQVGFDFSGTAYLMTLAYGGQYLEMNNLVNAEPVYMTTEEARSFEKLEAIHTRGLYPLIFERIQAFQDLYPRVPIGISDNQSPVDVITSLWKSDDVMIAMYEEPELVHRVLSALTDSIIEINKKLAATIQNFAGYSMDAWIPYGMHVSDDNAAFLSPQIYQEFAAPYVTRLSKEFGGVDFHCCMGYRQNLANMAAMPGFISFDPQDDYNPVADVLAALPEGKAFRVNTYPWQQKEKRSETNLETLKRIMDETEGRNGLIIRAWEDTPEKAMRLAEQVKEYAIETGRY
jgi:hypothetical protein